MCSLAPHVFPFVAAGRCRGKRSSGQHLAQSHGCRCPNCAVQPHGSPGFAAADVDLRWLEPLQPQKSKRCSLSDTFCVPCGCRVGGVAAAMWPRGGYVTRYVHLNDLHYFSIEAMFAGRVCALSCFCKFLLWISCVHVPVYWVELGL